ncbi:unnamed protein product [Arctogadus glacialis]
MTQAEVNRMIARVACKSLVTFQRLLSRFKLRWLRTQERKDNAKASLLAECRKSAQDEHQLTNTQPQHQLSHRG